MVEMMFGDFERQEKGNEETDDGGGCDDVYIPPVIGMEYGYR